MKKMIMKLVGIPLLLFICLLILVFATEQTFGQRCAKEYNEDTTEWCDCVERLSQGGEVKTINTEEK